MQRCGLYDRGSIPGSSKEGIFFFLDASILALGPIHSPIQWIPGALSSGVMLLGREADHSPPPSAEVKCCAKLHLHFPIRLSAMVHS
jgi:hypothetical protein